MRRKELWFATAAVAGLLLVLIARSGEETPPPPTETEKAATSTAGDEAGARHPDFRTANWDLTSVPEGESLLTGLDAESEGAKKEEGRSEEEARKARRFEGVEIAYPEGEGR